MNRDDIIRMARDAGLLEIIDDAYQERADWGDYVERFAALVAAAGANAALEAAARKALEAWDDPVGAKDFCVAMDALRAALKEKA